MKGIIWRFKKFEYRDTKKSNFPKGVKKVSDFHEAVEIFGESIAIFICIEKEDKEEISGKEEVIIPAYTSASLLFAIKKAGLKPAFLCLAI